jgi:hypothetical protein
MTRTQTLALVSLSAATLAPAAALADWLPWNGSPMVTGQKFAMLVRGHCGAASVDGGSGDVCTDPVPPGWVEVAADGFLVVGHPQMSPPDNAVFTVSSAPGQPVSFNASKGRVHAGASGDTPTALRCGGTITADTFAFDAADGSIQLSRTDGSAVPIGVALHAARQGAQARLAVLEGPDAEPSNFSIVVSAPHLTLSASFGTISGAGPDCSSTCVSPAQYPATPITLKATTSPGYHFLHWGGLCQSQKTPVCTLPEGILSDGEVSAVFSTQYELTVKVQGPGEVLVVSGSDTRCSATNPCTVPIIAGLKVPVMSLHPKDVVAWTVSTGQSCLKSVSCEVAMDGNIEVVAKYTGQHCPGSGECPAGKMTP